jgi:predicted ATP-grasp superfamily ATP-dependent carboligase
MGLRLSRLRENRIAAFAIALHQWKNFKQIASFPEMRIQYESYGTRLP